MSAELAIRRLAAALLAVTTLLSACASESIFRPQPEQPASPPDAASETPVPRQSEPSPRPAPRPNVNLTGYPPAFQDGYSDGCASARAARKRDETRFKSDVQYAQGWRDGNSICRR